MLCNILFVLYFSFMNAVSCWTFVLEGGLCSNITIDFQYNLSSLEWLCFSTWLDYSNVLCSQTIICTALSWFITHIKPIHTQSSFLKQCLSLKKHCFLYALFSYTFNVSVKRLVWFKVYLSHWGMFVYSYLGRNFYKHERNMFL